MVISHGDVAGVFATVVAGGTPRVAVMQGMHLVRRTSGVSRWVVRWAMRMTFRNVRVVVCSSDAERQEVLALAPKVARRIVVFANSVPARLTVGSESRDSIRADLSIGDGTVVVVYVGEVEPRKRVLDAAAAVARARDQGVDVDLLVVGDGPELPMVRQVRSGGRPVAHCVGRKADVAAFLAAADIFVMPSEREGQSFAVLEAMAAGLALIVSDGPGNAEAVGADGVVVGLGDVAGLAAAIGQLAGDEAARAALGARAAARFERLHSNDAFRRAMSRACAVAVDG